MYNGHFWEISPTQLCFFLAQRQTCSSSSNASQIWKLLLKSLHIIQHWLCWKPGSGHSIHVGRDALLGLGSSAYLSQELLVVLNQHNIFFLFQAKGTTVWGTIFTQWKDCTDLSLSGNLELEWHRFCKGTSWSGDSTSGPGR
jgi:hypothetical protein